MLSLKAAMKYGGLQGQDTNAFGCNARQNMSLADSD